MEAIVYLYGGYYMVARRYEFYVRVARTISSTTFRRFPKILQNLFQCYTAIANHFPKISKDYRKLLKTFEEGPKMFRP